MIQILHKTNIDFIKYRKIAIWFSIILTILTIVSVIYHRGFNYSIDFVGGTLVQVKFEKPVKDDLGKIRSSISSIGYGSPEVKAIGTENGNELQITVRSNKSKSATIGEDIKTALVRDYPQNKFEARRLETVGPKVGGELKRDAILSLSLALLAIMLYIALRFKLSYGVAALIPLFHDVVITAGFFSVLNIEFSLAFIAALLTIVGYSLNDNVVIFDRIRENMKTGMKGRSFIDIVNISLNQTLSRTIITSGITFAVVTFLYFIGSEAIKDFALALMVGVVFGTYSTIYIASPILVWWNRKWPIKP
jgi:preprotein translocase subunit SecF